MSTDITTGKLLDTARQLVVNMEQNFMRDALALGKILREIRETKAWSEGYDSFDNPEMHNFLEDIGLQKQLANKLILLHERFVMQGANEQKLLQTSWSRLAEALPYAKDADEDRLEELVDFAIAAPTKDEFRKMLKLRYSEVPEKECTHEDTYTLVCCRDCGTKLHK